MNSVLFKIAFRFVPLAVALSCTGSPALASQPKEWEAEARNALQQGQLDVARRQAENALLSPRTAAAAHELLGHIACKENHDRQAVLHFEAAKALHRLTPEMERNWSGALLNLKQYGEARRILEQALSRDPSQKDLRYRLAGAYLEEGHWREAWPHLEQVHREGLSHAAVVMQLARARFAVGQDYQAVDLLRDVGSSGSSADLLFQAGKLLFEKTLYRQAVPLLEKVWGQAPGSYDIGMYLALCHYLMEEYSDSEQVLIQIQTGSEKPLDYQILLGSVHARLGQWQKAREELELAVHLYPQRADGYLNLGLFCLEREEHSRAMELLEKASRMMTKGTKLLYTIRSRKNCEGLRLPDAARGRQAEREKFYTQLAEMLHSMQQKGSALAVFLLALEVDPTSAKAHAGIGRVCWEMDSLPQSRAFLERGRELHPQSPDLLFTTGLVDQSLGDSVEAIRAYERAIQSLGPDAGAEHWIQLGTAQADSGKFQEAGISFRKGLSLDPAFAQGHYELGKLCFREKHFECAEEALETATRLDPKLLGAYYQFGMTCLRLGKTEKGKELLEAFHRKKELYGPDQTALGSMGPP
ncbi:MAG: tetratricopeptide repeat protein [Acidobacteriota bacterium]